MRAICWNGVNDLRCETIPDPAIESPRDVIVKVALSSTCGSDLHFIHGIMPNMRDGDVLGHEFCGEVVEVGSAVTHVKKGDRVVVPSIISCGDCWYCNQGEYEACDNGHPDEHGVQEKLIGYTTAGFYGCSHTYGGFAGSHAEYIRIPYGDVGCFKIPDGLSWSQALFISDAVPTAWMGAEFADIQPGETVAVWGCGAVGLLAQQSALLMGAGRVIAIDQVPERLARARDTVGAETIDFSQDHEVSEILKEMTGGRGPDRCIDAVGMEAQGHGVTGAYDKVKQKLHLATDRGEALRQAMLSVRKAGTLSILGVYFMMDKFPLGMLVNKNITVRAGLQNGHKYIPRLLEMAQDGRLDASWLDTHRFPLSDPMGAYDMFRNKEAGCLRAVFEP